MSIVKRTGIEKGYYGTYHTDKDGNETFVRAGKKITIKFVQYDLDTNLVTLILEFEYLGKKKTVPVSRDVFTDPSLIKTLSGAGADISRKTYDIAIDSLRLQEKWLEKNNYTPINVYNNLGWLRINTPLGAKACFRSYRLIGDSGTYTGDYKIAPMGSFKDWRQMVIDDVLGDTVAELTLIAALSAVIVTIVTPVNDPGNPILHLYGISGCGKSTDLELATSVGGEPFGGNKIVTNSNGSLQAIHSLYRSWGATENALVGSCAGNNGYPIILNELGKSQSKDLSTVVYDLSEGTDKTRYSKNMQVMQSQGYATSFISSGEHSLLDRCSDKSDGLQVRVLELEMVKTPGGAKRADRIKRVCKKNNGHAIPMLAQHISGVGFQKVQELFKKNYEESIEMWTPSPSYERFVSKFVALYLTTADLASQALGIPFNKEAIRDFLMEYDKKNGAKRNSALSSYDTLIQEFNMNRSKFVCGDSAPKTECWGKITKENKKITEKKQLVERFLVYKEVVNKLLEKHGYKNYSTCYKEWKTAGLIDFDKGKHMRKRTIHPTSTAKEYVFVFNVFDDPTILEHKDIYKETNLLEEEEK